MNCNEAVSALVASLERGDPMTAEQREHIRTCEKCRELLDSAKQFQTLLGGNGIQPPSVDTAAAKAEEEVRQARVRRQVWTAIAGGALAIIGVTAFFALVLMPNDLGVPKIAVAATGVMIVVTIVGITLGVLRGLAERSKRFYKRLGPGRMLSGVCLGLSEATGANVTLLRLAAVALLFVDGVGLWLYILLDLMMPVHPDDRQYLLRFKLRRWFRKETAYADNAAR